MIMPEPQSESLGEVHSIRRSVTFPTKLIPKSTRGSAAPNPTGAENVIFYHPSAKIVLFAPRALAPIPSSSAPTDFDYPVDTIETHPWRSATERTVATAPLRLEKVHGLTVFLKCGDVVHAILKNSQCWCVDGVSKFVLRIRPLTYYRIEIPNETHEDKRLVEDLKIALPTVLRYEVTPCPFKREFTVELPEEAMAPRRKKAWRPKGPKGRKEGVAALSGSDQGSPVETKPEWLDSASTGEDTDGAATDDSAVTPEQSGGATSEVLPAHDLSASLAISEFTPQPISMRRSVTETPQTFSTLRAKFDVPQASEEQPLESAPEIRSDLDLDSAPEKSLNESALISMPAVEPVSAVEPGPAVELVPAVESVVESEPASALTQTSTGLVQSDMPIPPKALGVEPESTLPTREKNEPTQVATQEALYVKTEEEDIEIPSVYAEYESTDVEPELIQKANVPSEPIIEDNGVLSRENNEPANARTNKQQAFGTEGISEPNALGFTNINSESAEVEGTHVSYEVETKDDDKVADPILIEALSTGPKVADSNSQLWPQTSNNDPEDDSVSTEAENHHKPSFSSTPESFHSAEPHSPSDSISTHATSLGSPSTKQKYKTAFDQDLSSLDPTTKPLVSDTAADTSFSNVKKSLNENATNFGNDSMTRENSLQPSVVIASNSGKSTAKASPPSDLSHMSAEFRRRAQATRQRDVSPMPAPSAIYQPTTGEEATSLISKALALVLVPPIHLFIVLLHIAARIVINPSMNSTRPGAQSRPQLSSRSSSKEDDFSFPLEREPSSEYEDAEMTKRLDPWDLD
ncbi:hypothetical protein N7466_008400 [Penicillium verhagenii]|uniref:uncharacterized protein n=1 Tax=Penicillium verhagenii TaxID=1562060 RepID=UPI002545B3BB|nr:uncharacterized protein N7466_008400 [Penicillium verhagenii]KAJ5924213.1 hypothetical protein N7466_008400 [Penicillium verhagenii]